MNIDMILRILGGVLGAQVLLAAITWWPSGGTDAEPRDLVSTDAAELSKIVVHPRAADDATPLELEKKNGDWVIASLHDYPADAPQLDTLFETIDKIQVVSPVSRRDYNHAEMDVSADTYSRKLELTDAAGTTTLYVGSAQGKSAHVRVDGSDDVFRVRGVSSAIAERPTQYFSRDFQKVEVDGVQSMTILRPGEPPIEFQRVDDAWTLPGITPEGKVVDPFAADTFVRTALNLRMLEPVGTTVSPEMGLDAGARVTWTEQQADGSSFSGEYAVGAQAGDEASHVYLKSSTSPYVFKGLTGQLQHAREKTVDELFTDPAPPPPAPAGDAPMFDAPGFDAP